jgi:CheY-like chemotaxis protein
MNLPEMSGTELCSALTASGHDLPVVLITGRNDSSAQHLIEQAHPVAALFKRSTSALCSTRSLEHLLVLMDDLNAQRHLHVADRTEFLI